MKTKQNSRSFESERRINLCFNLDDPRQKAVYEYLASAGREKTATVVNIVLQHIMADKRWKNDLMEREVRFVERFESLIRQIEAQRTVQLRNELEDIFNNLGLHRTSLQTEQMHEEKANKPCSNDEMSDDAFDAVMAFMG